MKQNDCDVLIIGAGPAGLALSISLADAGLQVAVVERQPESVLQNPPFDGREIALTHRSVDRLQVLGALERIPEAQISPLSEARVVNGTSPREIRFAPDRRAHDSLGTLVPNHLIRKSLYESARTRPTVQILTERTAIGIETGRESAALTLEGGTRLSGQLIVAADTRFSETRRRMGISASMRDFGKTMLVCRMTHEKSHGNVATEWFDYGQTIAMLPLNDNASGQHMSSLVLTMPARQIERLLASDEASFSTEISARYRCLLGAMTLSGTRHTYPLVSVYASRFVAERFALVGDAAVGMHPVTAHGLNFGLLSEQTLSSLVAGAVRSAADIGAEPLLRRYEAQHRRATHPLYWATNTIAMLYTEDRLPARLLRSAVIHAGERLAPVRRTLVATLMQDSAGRLPRSLLRSAFAPRFGAYP